MRAGSMDRKVTFKQASETGVSDSGQPEYTWHPILTCWAEVIPLAGRETPAAGGQLVAKADVKIRIRYPAAQADDIRPVETVRVEYAGRDYDITHVAEIGRREGLDVFAFTRAE